MVKAIVFFLEEPSAKEMLQGLLPRLLPRGVAVRYVTFQGKQDLEKNLEKRLKGWREPDSAFVIMRDQDSGDCRVIKEGLVKLCRQAGKEDALVRVACRELESFYLGDLAAVEKGLDVGGIGRQQQKRKFRSPDQLGSPSGGGVSGHRASLEPGGELFEEFQRAGVGNKGHRVEGVTGPFPAEPPLMPDPQAEKDGNVLARARVGGGPRTLSRVGGVYPDEPVRLAPCRRKRTIFLGGGGPEGPPTSLIRSFNASYRRALPFLCAMTTLRTHFSVRPFSFSSVPGRP